MATAATTTNAGTQRSQIFGINRRVFRNNLDGWLFASPWIIGFILWTLGPMLASLFISLVGQMITEQSAELFAKS